MIDVKITAAYRYDGGRLHRSIETSNIVVANLQQNVMIEPAGQSRAIEIENKEIKIKNNSRHLQQH